MNQYIRPNKKPIVVFGPSFYSLTTGESISLSNLADSLMKLGHSVILLGVKMITMKPGDKFESFIPDYKELIKPYPNSNLYVIEIPSFGNKVNELWFLNFIRMFHVYHRPEAYICLADTYRYIGLCKVIKELDAPVVLNAIHDSFPYPESFHDLYTSFDLVACLTKNSYNIYKEKLPLNKLCHLTYKKENYYKKLDKDRCRAEILPNVEIKGKIFGWVNVNMERKNLDKVLYGFKKHVEKYPDDILLIHTTNDLNTGYNIYDIQRHEQIRNLYIDAKSSEKAEDKTSNEIMNKMYNCFDFIINCPINEGFGMSSLCAGLVGVPRISTLTGGLVEQEPEIVIQSESILSNKFNLQPKLAYMTCVMPSQVADALDYASSISEEEYNKMSEHAYSVASQYTEENHLKQLSKALKLAKDNFQNRKSHELINFNA